MTMKAKTIEFSRSIAGWQKSTFYAKGGVLVTWTIAYVKDADFPAELERLQAEGATITRQDNTQVILTMPVEQPGEQENDDEAG